MKALMFGAPETKSSNYCERSHKEKRRPFIYLM